MWTNYLKLGSLLLMAICTACHQNIDYIVKGDWIYINQTPHQISIQGKFENIILPAYGQDSIQITAGEGPKNVEPSNYVSPFESKCNIIINDTVHIAINKGSISEVGNYRTVKVGYNHFRFTYIFTNKSIEELLEQKQKQTL